MPEKEMEMPAIPGYRSGEKTLLVFFETDCPTCQLALPYLNGLRSTSVQVIAVSQDDMARTRQFVEQMQLTYRVEVDYGLKLSRAYDPQSVPTMYLLDEEGQIEQTLVGLDKNGLNSLAKALGQAPIAPDNDGAPAWKPGCSSRHLEPATAKNEEAATAPLLRRVGEPA